MESKLMMIQKKPTVAVRVAWHFWRRLELVMGFHARIAAPRTQLDLRELTLRVIPGFGGIYLFKISHLTYLWVLENKQLPKNHVAFNMDKTASKADWIAKSY
ncbi:hypothetical protein Leryth_001929 [Lithospermum erythrorhizon]|nr:hypothetical protein Leryth_001929 [Lithospermum erythrorhizon]